MKGTRANTGNPDFYDSVTSSRTAVASDAGDDAGSATSFLDAIEVDPGSLKLLSLLREAERSRVFSDSDASYDGSLDSDDEIEEVKEEEGPSTVKILTRRSSLSSLKSSKSSRSRVSSEKKRRKKSTASSSCRDNTGGDDNREFDAAVAVAAAVEAVLLCPPKVLARSYSRGASSSSFFVSGKNGNNCASRDETSKDCCSEEASRNRVGVANSNEEEAAAAVAAALAWSFPVPRLSCVEEEGSFRLSGDESGDVESAIQAALAWEPAPKARTSLLSSAARRRTRKVGPRVGHHSANNNNDHPNANNNSNQCNAINRSNPLIPNSNNDRHNAHSDHHKTDSYHPNPNSDHDKTKSDHHNADSDHHNTEIDHHNTNGNHNKANNNHSRASPTIVDINPNNSVDVNLNLIADVVAAKNECKPVVAVLPQQGISSDSGEQEAAKEVLADWKSEAVELEREPASTLPPSPDVSALTISASATETTRGVGSVEQRTLLGSTKLSAKGMAVQLVGKCQGGSGGGRSSRGDNVDGCGGGGAEVETVNNEGNVGEAFSSWRRGSCRSSSSSSAKSSGRKSLARVVAGFSQQQENEKFCSEGGAVVSSCGRDEQSSERSEDVGSAANSDDNADQEAASIHEEARNRRREASEEPERNQFQPSTVVAMIENSGPAARIAALSPFEQALLAQISRLSDDENDYGSTDGIGGHAPKSDGGTPSRGQVILPGHGLVRVGAGEEENASGTTPYRYRRLAGISRGWPPKVDPAHREEWLSPVEFEAVFGMRFGAFKKLPPWKKVIAKQEVRLF